MFIPLMEQVKIGRRTRPDAALCDKAYSSRANRAYLRRYGIEAVIPEPRVSPQVLDEIVARELVEVLPLTHIRGRSLHDAFVIVDEAQSLERNVLLTVLSRIGQNSRVVLTHDVNQRDNLRVGRHDGITSVVEKLKGHPLFGHVTLTRSERSEIAGLVTEVLGDF